MARIKQVGPGRKTTGTIDGITYVTRNGVTYARATPTMPAYVFKTPGALKRQAVFKLIQMHLKYHLRTIKQTFTPKGNGTSSTRYHSVNGKALTAALSDLADRYVAGEVVTLTQVEEAISAYAALNPEAITIAKRSGYGDVFLTGEWPSTITLRASGGDSTIIIIVAENGSTTTINPDGSTTVEVDNSSSGSSGSSGSSTGSETGGNGSGSGSQTPTVAAPTISGSTPFEETTEVSISAAAGASIYYTVDGSVPTSSSTQYSAAFTLSDTTTVKAIAVADGVSSSVASKTFTKGDGEDVS